MYNLEEDFEDFEELSEIALTLSGAIFAMLAKLRKHDLADCTEYTRAEVALDRFKNHTLDSIEKIKQRLSELE